MYRTNGRTKAYSYPCFSTPDQKTGDSTLRQIEAAERYAAHHVAKILRSPTVIGTLVPYTVNYHPETGKRRYERAATEVPDY